VPLLKIKLTSFAGGGTAIGLLAQHGVVDAESIFAFMTVRQMHARVILLHAAFSYRYHSPA
jgi:hypothetical protein